MRLPLAASAAASVFCTLLLPNSAAASKVTDGLTTGSDGSISNAFNAALDLGKVFTLEAAWQLLDTEAGKTNTFSAGGDIKFGEHFDIDVLADFAPRTSGVRTAGLSITPTLEIDEGDDFFTSFSLLLLAEQYNIFDAEHCARVLIAGKRRLMCSMMGRINSTSQTDLTQLGGGLIVEQGFYDGSILVEGTTNHYSDVEALSAFGREFLRGGGAVKFNQLGALLPTFPVLHEGKLQLSYKFRFMDGGFALKPVVSAQHLVYEANHGHGEVLVAKLVATFAKTIELTAGYQLLVDSEIDPSMPRQPAQTVDTHYGLVMLGWIFGKDEPPPPPPESPAAESST